MKASFAGLLGLFGLVLATTACGPDNSPSDAGGVPDSGSATPDSGSWPNDSGSIAPDTGSGMHDSGSGTPDTGSGTQDSGSGEYPLNVRFANDCGFVACGGNVVGNWRPQEVCLPPPDLGSSCPGARVEASGVVRGYVSITGTNIDENVIATLRTTMTLPMSCLGGASCDMIQNELRRRLPDATCMTMGTNCQCTFSETDTHVENHGYSVSGNLLVLDGGAETYEYCVRGGMFRFRRVSGGSTQRVWTLIPR